MSSHKIGDVVSDCPSCDGAGTVTYKGNDEAICNQCGSLYDVTFDGEDEPVDDPVVETEAPQKMDSDLTELARLSNLTAIQLIPEPVVQKSVGHGVTPTPVPAKAVPPKVAPPKVVKAKVVEEDTAGSLKIEDSGLASITDLVAKKSETKDPLISAFERYSREFDLPNYLFKSRPWRWVYELLNTGNPYRRDTRSHFVYDTIEKSDGLTSAEVVARVSTLMGDRLSYLLTLYEVISQCVASGLLLIDEKTRKITACKGQPKPARMP